MKILLTGGSGLLGTELRKLRNYLAPIHKEMDITDYYQTQEFIWKHQPKMIVHVAAYTNTIAPEHDQDEAMKCYKINVLGTRNLVKAALGIPIIYISTEAVLEITSFYSLTKAAGEIEIKKAPNYSIIRTSFKPRPWPYEKACVDAFTISDYVDVIASLIDNFIEMPRKGIHYIGTGIKTMYDLAIQTKPKVQPIKRAEITDVEIPSLAILNNYKEIIYA